MERQEAFRALNMGVGFLFIVPAAQREQALDALRAAVEAGGLGLSDTSTVEDGGRVVSEVIVGGPA